MDAKGELCRCLRELERGGSRLSQIVDVWLQTGDIAPEDRDWLNERCASRRFSIDRQGGLEVSATWDDGNAESVATFLFMQMIKEMQDRNVEDDFVPFQHCVVCDKLFQVSKFGKRAECCSERCRRVRRKRRAV